MAVNRRLVRATPEDVWAVLADGHAYEHFVVGTRDIRRVDAGFPAVGTRLHYRVGYGPLRKDGVTEVQGCVPGTQLVLEAEAWPVGTAVIVLEVEPAGVGTRVSLTERPARGLAAKLHNPAADLAIRVRNVETLRRLAALAEGRAGGTERAAG